MMLVAATSNWSIFDWGLTNRRRGWRPITLVIDLNFLMPAFAVAGVNGTRIKNAKRELSLLKVIEAMDFEIRKHDQQYIAVKGKIKSLESALSKLKPRVDALESKAANHRNYFARRLSANNRISRRGRFELLVGAKSFRRYLQRRWLLRRLIERDKKRFFDLKVIETKYNAELTTLRRVYDRMRRAKMTLAGSRVRLDAARKEKGTLLAKI